MKVTFFRLWIIWRSWEKFISILALTLSCWINSYEISDLFYTRYKLHKQIYTHSCVRAIEYIILDILNILKPKYYIPAGGSYIVSGKNANLQKFVAHPSPNTVKNFFKKNSNSKVLQLDCGSEVKLKKNKKSCNKIRRKN